MALGQVSTEGYLNIPLTVASTRITDLSRGANMPFNEVKMTRCAVMVNLRCSRLPT